MEQRLERLRRLELGGGQVTGSTTQHLELPAGIDKYADAQLDDYGLADSRKAYAWRPGTELSLRARFSHPGEELVGTAGFGFWNAPFGDPSIGRPTLPRATWFFFAAPPTDLPLASEGPGRGWFASTIDASQPRALALAPLAPLALLANQSAALRRHLWPPIQRRLGISFAPITIDMTIWHTYRLAWEDGGCRFWVDGSSLLDTTQTPSGPLGFVCWMDNQYLIATPRGRFASGTLSPSHEQWLEITDLTIT